MQALFGGNGPKKRHPDYSQSGGKRSQNKLVSGPATVIDKDQEILEKK